MPNEKKLNLRTDLHGLGSMAIVTAAGMVMRAISVPD